MSDSTNPHGYKVTVLPVDDEPAAQRFRRRASDRLPPAWRSFVKRWTPLAVFLGALGGAVPLLSIGLRLINWRALGFAMSADVDVLHKELHGFFEQVRPGLAEEIHNRAARSREE